MNLGCFTEDAFLDNLPHWYPLCNHDDSKGLDIPQPTVLPPKSNRATSASPRALSVDRHERSSQAVSKHTSTVKFSSVIKRLDMKLTRI